MPVASVNAFRSPNCIMTSIEENNAISEGKQSRIRRNRTAIEEQSFPFEQLSEIAEIESWRKEVNRPIYHIHKWWAQRLGSVFRAILISAFSPAGTDILAAFYSRRMPS